MQLDFQKDLAVSSTHIPVDQTFFNKRFKAIFDALKSLDAQVQSFGATEGTLLQLGLARLNDTLGPLLTTLQSAAELTFLVAHVSGAAHSLVAGEAVPWIITEGAELFAPTPYLLAQDDTDSTNWGILSLDAGGWTRSAASLATHVVYRSKTQSSSQWTISANSAQSAAFQDTLNATIAAKNLAVAAQTYIDSQMATLQAAITAIQSGPVASVAGKTGAVSLVIGDIAALTATLADKATTTDMAGRQLASSKLDALVNLAWAANRIIYSTGSGTLGTLVVTDFIKTLLDDADASTAMTTLGISTFAKSLLDDADASTMQSTLGISTFVKTLLNDADAATFFTTLGFAGFAKANAGDVTNGTDDAKFITSLAAANQLKRVNVQAGAYTLQLTDNRQIVRMTSATGVNVTVPNNLPIGFTCRVWQGGAGRLTFVPAAGGTRLSVSSQDQSVGQYSMVDVDVVNNVGGSAANFVISGSIT